MARDLMLQNPEEFAIYRCSDCGSGTTMPFVSEEELPALYAGEYAPFTEYTASRGLGWALKLVRRFVDWQFHEFSVARAVRDERGRLLEVGCGTGRFGSTFIDRGWDVYGIEPSPGACEQAAGRGMKMHNGTLGTFDAPNEPFDAVLLQHSLEHVVHPREELARAYALLRPGGKLLIEVPNFGSWQARAFKEYWFHNSVPMHRTHFTAAGLESAAVAAGFEPVEMRFSTGALSIPASLEYRLFGRWLHAGRLSNAALFALSICMLPITKSLDALRGGGDMMRFVARRPE